MSDRSILFISANGAVREKIEGMLNGIPGEIFRLFPVEALFDGLRFLQERSFDLIIADLVLPDGQGTATVRHLQQHAPAAPLIVLCDPADRDAAVTAVREGAYDFFCYDDIEAESFKNSVKGSLEHASSEAEKKAAAERRTNARFPCRLAVSYQTLERPVLSGQGTSETLNISSKGILFTCNEQFNAGQLIQVSLDWPARLENQIPLKLVAEGRVVRNSSGTTAMTIDKYEFRTRRTPARAQEFLPSDTAARTNPPKVRRP